MFKWLGDKIKPTVVTSDMKKDKIASLLKGFHSERLPVELPANICTPLRPLYLPSTPTLPLPYRGCC